MTVRTWEASSEPYRAGIHAYVGCPDGSWGCLWGVAGDRERVWPLFGVLADVKSGALGWWWPHNTLPLRGAVWLRGTRLS